MAWFLLSCTQTCNRSWWIWPGRQSLCMKERKTNDNRKKLAVNLLELILMQEILKLIE